MCFTLVRTKVPTYEAINYHQALCVRFRSFFANKKQPNVHGRKRVKSHRGRKSERPIWQSAPIKIKFFPTNYKTYRTYESKTSIKKRGIFLVERVRFACTENEWACMFQRLKIDLDFQTDEWRRRVDVWWKDGTKFCQKHVDLFSRTVQKRTIYFDY